MIILSPTLVNLSREEVSLLSKGLTFYPKPPRVNRFEFRDEFKAFTRRLRLMEYFHDQGKEEDDYELYPFRKKSSWNPPTNRDSMLETYIRAVDKDITMSLSREPKQHWDNRTKGERRALNSS